MQNNQFHSMSNNRFFKISSDTLHFLKQNKDYTALAMTYLELISGLDRGMNKNDKIIFTNSILAKTLATTPKKLNTCLKNLQKEGLIVIDDSKKGVTIVSILDHKTIVEKIV